MLLGNVKEERRIGKKRISGDFGTIKSRRKEVHLLAKIRYMCSRLGSNQKEKKDKDDNMFFNSLYTETG